MLLGFLLGFDPAVRALDLEQEYILRRYAVDQGLPQNSVTRITQTADGYLWFATYRGLVRFDGVRFDVFDRSTPGLVSGQDSVDTMFLDTKGRLTVALKGGQVLWIEGGRVRGTADLPGFPTGPVGIRGESPDGRRHFLQVATGVWFREQPDGSYKPAPESKAFGIRVDRIDQIAVREAGIPWLLRADGTWAQTTLHDVTPALPPTGRPTGNLVQAVAARAGGLWLVSEWGVHRYKDGQWLFHEPLPSRIGASSGGLEDAEGNLWIATWGEGLWRFGPDHRFQLMSVGKTPTSETVRSLFEDAEGNIWIGTEGSGVLRLRRRLFRTPGGEAGFHFGITRSVTEDPDGFVWVSGQDGLHRIGPEPASRPDLVLRQALGRPVYADSIGRVWHGTYSGWVQWVDSRDLRKRVRLDLPENSSVHAFLEEPGVGVWVGREDGLYLAAGDGVRRQALPVPQEFSSVRALVLGPDGILWAGLEGGGLLHRDADGWKRFPLPGTPERFGVSALLVDSARTLWVATEAAGMFHVRDGVAGRLDPNELWLPRWPSSLVEDGFRNLWIGANDGVYRVGRAILDDWVAGRTGAGMPQRFGPEDGLESSEGSAGVQPAAIRARDGHLWFATYGGASVVDPGRVNPDTSPPKALVETLEFLGPRPRTFRINGVVGPEPGGGTITVPNDVAAFEFRYTAPRFSGAERVRFRHRLQGFDSEWISAGTRRVASFQGLPPGDYRFELSACNEDGVWGPTSAPVRFRVEPRLWQTTGFRVLSVLGGVAAVFGAYRRRIRKFTQDQRAQQEFSRRLIDSQEAERQRIARELHDSLGQNLLVIRNRAAMALQALGSPDRVRDQLNEVAEVASGSIREVREISQDLRPFQLDELGLERALSSNLQRVASASAIRIRWDLQGLGACVPREQGIHLFRIVQEAVNNVVKHSRAATCEVLVSRESGFVQVEIVDDGCGFDLGRESDGAEAAWGNGLSNIRERARLLGARFDIRTAPTFGTRIVVRIPVPNPTEREGRDLPGSGA